MSSREQLASTESLITRNPGRGGAALEDLVSLVLKIEELTGESRSKICGALAASRTGRVGGQNVHLLAQAGRELLATEFTPLRPDMLEAAKIEISDLGKFFDELHERIAKIGTRDGMQRILETTVWPEEREAQDMKRNLERQLDTEGILWKENSLGQIETRKICMEWVLETSQRHVNQEPLAETA